MLKNKEYQENHNWNANEKPKGDGISLGVMYNMRPKLQKRYTKWLSRSRRSIPQPV